MFLLLVVAVLVELPSPGVEANGCGGIEGVYICNPVNPTVFDICVGDQKYTMSCPSGLHFNSRTQICDWPKNADCGKPKANRGLPPSTPGYRNLYTNPFSPPTQRATQRSGGDAGLRRYEEGTARPVTVRNLGPSQLRHGQDSGWDGSRDAQPSGPDYNFSQQGEDDGEEAGGNSLHKTRTSTVKGRRRGYRIARGPGRDFNNPKKNPFLYKGERGEKHRAAILRQKYRTTSRALNNNRRMDDGYDQNYDNAVRKGRFSSTKPRWWSSAENDWNDNADDPNRSSSRDDSVFNNNNQNNDNSNSFVDSRQQKHNYDDDDGGSNTDNNNRNSNTNDDGGDGNTKNNMNSLNKDDRRGRLVKSNNVNNNIYNSNDNNYDDSGSNFQDRFTLAHYPWWTSRSSTPRDLRQRFAPPTPRPPQSRSRYNGRRQPQVSRAAAGSRRRSWRRQGLAPAFQPAAAPRHPPTSSAVRPVPPQQPMSAAKSITAAAAAAPKRSKKPRKTGE